MPCGEASRILLVRFLSMWPCFGLTELCRGVRHAGPQSPKSSTMKTSTWHCSIEDIECSGAGFAYRSVKRCVRNPHILVPGCLGARDSNQDPLANRIARIESRDFEEKNPNSQSPDLPLPHGLAPSETMVSDHGLGPPLSTENPRNKGFSVLRGAHFWIWSRRPRDQRVGVYPGLLINIWKNSKDITADRTEFGVAIRIMRF